MQKTLAGTLALALLTGCSTGADVATAESGIAAFHRELNAGAFGDIYGRADEQMKRVTTQAAMIQLLAAVHRKLGAFISGRSAGWNDNLTTGGHFMTFNYSSQYMRGPADENFVFRIEGRGAILVGYHVNSTALILN